MDQRPKHNWFWDFLSPDLMYCASILEIAYSGRTPYQSVEVINTGSFGWCLVLDGKIQSSDADEFIYHEALVHLPMITHNNPKAVFIAGGGEGAVAREVLAHRTVEKVVMVDIDEQVIDLCNKYLPQRHRGAFDDPRFQLILGDAKKVLMESTEKYDVVILDLPDPTEGGPAYLLYTQAFYRLIRERLNKDGIAVTQAGNCNPVPLRDIFISIHNTMQSVFPSVFPYQVSMPAFGGTWGFVMATMGQNPLELDSKTVDNRIADKVTATLHFYDGITHEGVLRLPKELRTALAGEKRIITEDAPLFIY